MNVGEQAIAIWRYHLRADPNLCWGSSLRLGMQKGSGWYKEVPKKTWDHRIPPLQKHQVSQSPKINPGSFSASPLFLNLATQILPPGGFVSPPRPPRSQSAASAAGRSVVSAQHLPPRAAASRWAPAVFPSSAGRIPPPRCWRCLNHPAVDRDPKDPRVPAAVPTVRTLDFLSNGIPKKDWKPFKKIPERVLPNVGAGKKNRTIPSRNFTSLWKVTMFTRHINVNRLSGPFTIAMLQITRG